MTGLTVKALIPGAVLSMLLESGLITGEALSGVLIAIIAAFIMPLLLMAGFGLAATLGVAALAFVIAYQYRSTMHATTA